MLTALVKEKRGKQTTDDDKASSYLVVIYSALWPAKKKKKRINKISKPGGLSGPKLIICDHLLFQDGELIKSYGSCGREDANSL